MATAEEEAEKYYNFYKLQSEEQKALMFKMCRLRAQGHTYKSIGEVTDFLPRHVSKFIGAWNRRYREYVRCNEKKLLDSITTVDPDYAYETDKRTVMQQMCALVMGKQVFMPILEQLENLNRSN